MSEYPCFYASMYGDQFFRMKIVTSAGTLMATRNSCIMDTLALSTPIEGEDDYVRKCSPQREAALRSLWGNLMESGDGGVYNGVHQEVSSGFTVHTKPAHIKAVRHILLSAGIAPITTVHIFDYETCESHALTDFEDDEPVEYDEPDDDSSAESETDEPPAKRVHEEATGSQQ